MMISRNDLDSAVGVGDITPFVATIEQMGRRDLAVSIVDLFASNARSFEQLDNIAKCYFKLKMYEKSMTYCENALSIAGNPQMAYVIRSNLINVYNHANYPEKALRYIEQNSKIIPSDVDTILEKAFSLFLLNRKDEAEAILTEVLENHPELSDEYKTKIRFNLGTYRLYQDRFQEGMRLFLEEGANMKVWNAETIFTQNDTVRFDAQNRAQSRNTFKKWDGTIHTGRPVVLHVEAGIGDEIINVRFVEHIKERGMIPYWFTTVSERRDLAGVFERNGVRVIRSLAEIEETGEVYYAQSMHTPMLLGLEYKDLWRGPYITPSASHVETFSRVLSKQDGRKKIAIRWQGNPMYDQDLHRSVPLKKIYEAVKHIDADFYCIQRDTGLDELADFPGLIDISDSLVTWENTLAILENVDCVITSCTSVLHAAAAMGKQTYALIPISAYYVWSHSGDKSPWYGDNVKILRQQRPRVWDEPLQKLSSLL